MRKLIVFNFMSLDGFFAGPNGEIDWHNYDSEMSNFSTKQMQTLGALIFGRTTYKIMESYWPTPEGIKSEPIVAQVMNKIPKIVFSKTMSDVADGKVWKNIHVFHEINKDHVRDMKEEGSGDIAIFGSGTIVQQLTDVIDEYRLMINPLTLGKGKPLFVEKMNLTLLQSRQFANGNVLLTYAKA